MPRGLPFVLASDLSLPPTDAMTVFGGNPNGSIVVHNGGGKSVGVGGHFVLDGVHADILLGMLPPIVHIRDEAARATLRWAMDSMMRELREPRPGALLIAQQLAYMMLVQALRLHVADGRQGGVGWLFALADRQMCAAITALHGDPARRWTLQELAGKAGMSRSTFAQRFKDMVGLSPMDYLTRWRMTLAANRLASTTDPISVIALSLGYESESAFSTAFKRVMGTSPRQYGQTAGKDMPSLAIAS
ncbi:MAG: AraC family transcriptional regulator [Azospirillaceae bacterium]|nr:AraC family transcriptional regulator [Azospirillaceae bacterium]